MRKSLIFLAAAASAVAVAAPASAQYYGGYIGNGYNNGYNSGYRYNGYGNNRYGYGDYARSQSNQLIAANRERMARIHSEIDQAAARGRMSPGEAAALHRRAAQFDRELAMLARGGMTGEEGAIFDQRADRLAQEVRARSGYGYGYNNGYGYGDGYGYNRW